MTRVRGGGGSFPPPLPPPRTTKPIIPGWAVFLRGDESDPGSSGGGGEQSGCHCLPFGVSPDPFGRHPRGHVDGGVTAADERDPLPGSFARVLTMQGHPGGCWSAQFLGALALGHPGDVLSAKGLVPCMTRSLEMGSLGNWVQLVVGKQPWRSRQPLGKRSRGFCTGGPKCGAALRQHPGAVLGIIHV